MWETRTHTQLLQKCNARNSKCHWRIPKNEKFVNQVCVKRLLLDMEMKSPHWLEESGGFCLTPENDGGGCRCRDSIFLVIKSLLYCLLFFIGFVDGQVLLPGLLVVKWFFQVLRFLRKIFSLKNLCKVLHFLQNKDSRKACIID